MKFGALAFVFIAAGAKNITLHIEDYPVEGLCGQRSDIKKSWLNPHYLFPTVFGHFKEGNCSDYGYARYNRTIELPATKKQPEPLFFDLYEPTQTRTITLELTDPSRPNRKVLAKFCMPTGATKQPLYIFGHGAGCVAEDYEYLCESTATVSIFQKSPVGNLFPVDFDSASAALDAKFLAQKLPELAASDPSSPLHGKLNGKVIIGGHSMGGGMTVLAVGKDSAKADAVALFAPGLYTKPDATPFLSSIKVPALIVSGAMDCGPNALDKQAQPAFDSLDSTTKVVVVLKGANHCQWTFPREKHLGACKTFEKNECHDIPYDQQQRAGAELVAKFSEALKGPKHWQHFEDFLTTGEEAGTWTFFSSNSSAPSKVLHNDCDACNGDSQERSLTV